VRGVRRESPGKTRIETFAAAPVSNQKPLGAPVKVIVRDPPLLILLVAIALDLPVSRSAKAAPAGKRAWFSRQLSRFFEWRNSLARRA
jgi:hypothetical protein